jgi:hypothetical protein
MCNILNINTEALSDKYMGLPAIVGADMSDCFMHFMERVIQMFKGWKKYYTLVAKRYTFEGCCPSYSYICHVSFSLAQEGM